MRDELSGRIMTDCATLRPKTYSYLTNDSDSKGTKKYVIKQNLHLKILSVLQKQLNLKMK